MLEDLYKDNLDHFSKSDHKIIEILMRNKDEIQYITSKELAIKANVSFATLSRFWGKIGFKNLIDFKNYLREKTHLTPASRISATLEQWNDETYNVGELLSKYQIHLEKTLINLSPETLKKAAECILSSSKIYIFAPDSSIGLAEIFIYRLNRLGLEFFIMKNGSAIYETMINISKNDLVIMFSYSRLLTEIEILLKHSQEAGYHTILFTDLITSKYLEIAEIILYSYRGEPNEYHSMMSPLALIDIIVLWIARMKVNPLEKMQYLEHIREKYSGLIKR